jgi:hypothetical protein
MEGRKGTHPSPFSLLCPEQHQISIAGATMATDLRALLVVFLLSQMGEEALSLPQNIPEDILDLMCP